jgi:hypothetical protein
MPDGGRLAFGGTIVLAAVQLDQAMRARAVDMKGIALCATIAAALAFLGAVACIRSSNCSATPD